MGKKSFTCRSCGKPVYDKGEIGECTCATLESRLRVNFPCVKCEFNKPVFGDPSCRLPSKNGCLDCQKVTPDEKSTLEEYKSAEADAFEGFPDISDDILAALNDMDEDG